MNPGLDLGLKACPHQPICGLTCCPFLWVVRAGREVRERAVMVLAVLVVLPEAGVQCRQAADAVHLCVCMRVCVCVLWREGGER
eukprot:1146388-Pelagomonas_calceolata.AAC.1